MSRLDELIAELCPDGVEYCKFSELCEFIRGVTYNKSQELQSGDTDGWKILRANNITLTQNVLNFDDVKLIKNEVKIKPTQFLKKGDILICAGSGSKEHVGKVAYIFEDMDYSFGGFMAVIRCGMKLNSRFLFHILTGSGFKNHLSYALNSTTINNLNASVMSNFIIPVPPLSVQHEIVRILDNFTELTAELTAELAAELTAHQKQYGYYRNFLLTKYTSDFTQLKLGEVATIRTGSKPNAILESKTEFEYINAGTTNSGYTNCFNCEGNTVTTPSRGQGGIGFIGYQKKPFWLGPLCYRIKSNDSSILLNKYLYYYLCNRRDLVLACKNEGGTPSVNASDLVRIEISIPSIEEQHRIVTILDRFDVLCNDISDGFPAEIAARQKQYEYYRDKLLSFEQKEK